MKERKSSVQVVCNMLLKIFIRLMKRFYSSKFGGTVFTISFCYGMVLWMANLSVEDSIDKIKHLMGW